MEPLTWLRKHLEEDGSDLLREMIREFAAQLMAAEAQGLCNAGYGEVSTERVNLRNGYRPREIDTRVGTIEVAIPKLRRGSYFPEWLLEPRRRAEQALTQVVCSSSSPTPTRGSRGPSRPSWPGRRGSAVAPTPCATC
jgi:transposase-like protein